MSKKYVVESQFEDLHADPLEEDSDLILDENSDNPIVRAALQEDNPDWKPPNKDEEDGDEEEEDPEIELEEEGDEEGEEDDDDGEEEDDTPRGKKVSKRIERERQLRKDAEDRQRETDRKLAALEAKDELRSVELEYNNFESDTNKKLRELREKKIKAREEGETSEEVDYDDEILDLKAELRTRKKAVEDQRTKVKNIEENGGDIDDSGVPEAGRKWIAKYPEFRTNSQFKADVLDADRMVARRGLDKNSNEYYEAIEKIIKEWHPDIVKKRSPKVTKKPSRSAVSGTQRAGTRRGKTRRGTIRLTARDQQVMRNFGLDPSNPTHVKEFAANKVD